MYSQDVEHEAATPPAGPCLERTCSCDQPLPHVQADRKWAARTYCERCGLPLPLSWR